VADPADIAHLLRRAEFVVRPARLAALQGGTRAAAVDDVLDISQNGSPVPPTALLTDDSAHRNDQLVAAYTWWIGNMVSLPRPIQEKVTLFWHGHFTSGIYDGVDRVDLMVHQNQLYRTAGMGRLHPLTQAMALEPAMLLYLSGANNIKGSPNENFARELMELFTLGVGNYAEDDVAASARAWTGYNLIDGAYFYIDTRHDHGQKTFFGTTKDWSGPQVIDEILRDNAGKKAIAARLISRKFWDFFAYPGPEAAVLDALTAAFLASDLDVTVLLRTMFNRDEFYSTAAKQGLVRTPTDYGVAVSYHTALDAKALNLLGRGDAMGQTLFDPPNVAGWKANSYWLNTSALSGRAQLARDTAVAIVKRGDFATLGSLSIADAITTIGAAFGITSFSDTTLAALTAGYTAERAIPKNTAATTNLVTAVMLTPEFHTA
jgi:uncharacterized protein (DUF1800 family)